MPCVCHSANPAHRSRIAQAYHSLARRGPLRVRSVRKLDAVTPVQDDLNALLPRTVEDAEIVSTVFLVMAGESWWLTLYADWTVSTDEADASPNVQPSLVETARLVTGRDLVAVRVGDDLRDPVFEFSGGLSLHLQSDAGEESWVMQVLGLPYRVVG